MNKVRQISDIAERRARKTRLRCLALLTGAAAVLAMWMHIPPILAEADKPVRPTPAWELYDNGLPWATVRGEDVRFRAGPRLEYEVIQKWSTGVAVEILGEENGWYQVLRWTYEKPMWVWGEYLELVE